MYQINLNFWIKGNVDDDLIFEYGEGVEAFEGCGATLMGEMWYFGGDYQSRQVSVLSTNELLFKFLAE